MHELIDPAMVETIRTTGATSPDLPDRVEVFEKHGLPFDRPAENVVITGCQIPGLLPGVLAAYSRVLDRIGVNHTFLSREYCCGNNLYRPAIKAHNNEALEECRDLSQEFVSRNLETACELGARRLIIFCSPCYPLYKHLLPDENVVFYPAALEPALGRMKLEERIDYYAGCYRLHRKFAPTPMDLASTNKILAGIEGLDVHRINAPKCCYSADGLTHMVSGVQTGRMVHICTGCYFQAAFNLPPERKVKVQMLPELVEEALGDGGGSWS